MPSKYLVSKKRVKTISNSNICHCWLVGNELTKVGITDISSSTVNIPAKTDLKVIP